MFIVGLLSWWYGAGYIQRTRLIRERMTSTIDYFSITLLLRTFFSPFRQISAGRVDGPIGVKWQAFVDRLVSRCIGAVIRFFMIFIGMFMILLYGIIGAVSLLLWVFIPLLPIVGVILMLGGWVPTWR